MPSVLCLPPISALNHRPSTAHPSISAQRSVVRRGEVGNVRRIAEKQNVISVGRISKFCILRQENEKSWGVCSSQSENASEASADNVGEEEDLEGQGMRFSDFQEFVELNSGCWGGHFYQFDALGKKLQQIPIRLNASSYGKGPDLALSQTLNIKQAPPKTAFSDEMDQTTWSEYKLNETNLSTVERPHQTVYFPGEGAYSVSHQTAEMLDKVLRAGVLGEDGNETDESLNGVKLPSRRPALVSESCLYSEDGNRRVRAFIVLDPRGLLDIIGVWREVKVEGIFVDIPIDFYEDDAMEKVNLMMGKWAGAAVTRRTGIYGSTVVENDVAVKYERLPGGFVSQELASSRGFKVKLSGQIKGSVLEFDGGLQTILLPGGIAVSAPFSVGRSVGKSQSFFFEFSWMESPNRRRRLVRTYDTDGLVVSTTLSSEKKM